MTASATEKVALAVRDAYSRLVALLASRSGDFAAAEDALADALVAALERWPRKGVPANPVGWLLAVARNRTIDRARRTARHDALAADLQSLQDEWGAVGGGFPDERLKLLFICANPAIDAALRTPLMLQTVLGLDAAAIGRAFLVSPATMSARLVRAKAKIRQAAIAFESPDANALNDRLPAVLDAIYGAFGLAWDDVPGSDSGAAGLTGEALFLARLAVDLVPQDPEPKGLLSLMLFCEARRAARRDEQGAFAPLDQQDVARWDQDMIAEAEHLLIAASQTRCFGRYQCEAAIQSAHIQRRLGHPVPADALVMLYNLLVDRVPSVGACIGLAAALVGADRAIEAEAVLTALDNKRVVAHQPYWAAHAAVMDALGRHDRARESGSRAAGLSEDAAIRAYLLQRYC